MVTEYKHPKTLWVLTISYALFMAALGGILATLVLFETENLHIPTQKAYGIFAAAMALLNIFPVGGGYIADKFGCVNAGRLGLLLGAFAMACFCFNHIQLMYLGLSLFVVSNALATPALWCMVDYGYAKDSVLREAGFTLFYLYFNVGAIVGIFLGGWLASRYGFAIEFIFDSICMLVGLLVLEFGKNSIRPYKGRSWAPQLKWSSAKLWLVLILITGITVPIILLLLDNLKINNVVMLLLLLGMIVSLVAMAVQQSDRIIRNKLFAFIFLAVVSIVFWTLYSLEPSFISVFVQNNVNRNFLGFDIPPSSFFAFDGIFVVLVGLILSRVWFYLDVAGKNPALSIKFAFSLIIIGLGFIFLGLATHLNGNEQLLPAIYVILAYAIFATGELFVGPLGIAMVGNLAPPNREGLLMGFWQLCIGIGGLAAGYIAIAPHLPNKPLPLATTNPLYIEVFGYSGLGSIIAGIIVLLFAHRINLLMHKKAHNVRSTAHK